MKTKLITTALFLTVLTGCDKQSEQAAVTEHSNNPTITAQFEQSDEKINKFPDQLEGLL